MRWSFTLTESKKRLRIVMTFVLLFIGAILLRLMYLQLWRGSDFAKDAERQLAYSNNQGNPRGHILDRNGDELAVSIMCESLYVDPSQIFKLEKKDAGDGNLAQFTAEILAPILHMQEKDVWNKCTQNSSFVWIKRTLNPDESRQVREAIKKYKLNGLHFIPESKRFYTKKRIAAQVLGFVGMDDRGGSGLELSLDRELRGAISKQKVYYDARGGEIISDLNNIKDTVPTVYLTLDMKMQYTLERAIDEAMAETKAVGAAAILMDPYTGEILAMVSRPTFDPNHYEDYKDTDWQNKCIGYNYEPGSVFKPIVGSAALQCRVVKPDDKMMDKGYYRDAENEINIENWNKKGRGEVTFSEVIKYSINTCMAEIGLKLGENNLVGFTEAFGFGKTTGIELDGEEEGILHDRQNMYKADIAVMSLGQGIEVTPLQMLRAICAIANGGDLLRPYIVKKIVAPNGEVTREGKRHVISRPISRDVANQMRRMMEEVVESGGGQAAGIKGYRIAGKTGTAQKLTKKGDYIDTKHIASFVGFVPANAPQYAMLVMLDEPQGKDFYGAQVASPVFRNTLQQILAAKGVQPQTGEVLKGFDEIGKLVVQRKIPKLIEEADGRLRVPDFTGIDMRACTEAMQGKLKLKPYGSGLAYKQLPKPNTLVPEDELIEVWFK
ncbi:MAG: peptidoglycan glycosyltransferase [Phascolarctobacterium sp.]|nr:peptidoglycan glycosyltransferase [Candidatus Phascolarctobacterium caballi]MCQ2380948.1 peptidoglycan glycosyltransferase [Acidaminococcaceae bacterium]